MIAFAELVSTNDTLVDNTNPDLDDALERNRYYFTQLQEHKMSTHGTATNHQCQNCEPPDKSCILRSKNCEFCGKALKRNETMNGHIRSIHENHAELGFHCNVCKKIISWENYLKQHIRRSDSNERNHCDKKQSNTNKHTRSPLVTTTTWRVSFEYRWINMVFCGRFYGILKIQRMRIGPSLLQCRTNKLIYQVIYIYMTSPESLLGSNQSGVDLGEAFLRTKDHRVKDRYIYLEKTLDDWKQPNTEIWEGTNDDLIVTIASD